MCNLVEAKSLLRAYESVDSCLAKCEARSNQHIVDLRQAYAGLQFICKERKTGIQSPYLTPMATTAIRKTLEFFDAVPCLAEYEPISMLRCSNEINQSQETTTHFINSLINREFHNVQSRFSSLCRLSCKRGLIPMIRVQGPKWHDEMHGTGDKTRLRRPVDQFNAQVCLRDLGLTVCDRYCLLFSFIGLEFMRYGIRHPIVHNVSLIF